MENTTVTNRRIRRPHRVAAVLAAGLITVVLGSIDTASAQPSEPENRYVMAPDAPQPLGGGAGGRVSFK